MIKAAVKTSVLITLLILVFVLRASQTHYAPTINHYLLSSESTAAYSWLFKASATSEESQKALVELAIANKNVYWLERMAQLGSLEATLALIDLDTANGAHYWLEQAAMSSHAPSQFELSLIASDKVESIRLKKLSAAQHYPPAIIALAKHYFDTGQTDLAKKYLLEASQYDPLSRLKLAKLQYKLGEKDAAIEHFRALSSSLERANKYVYALDNLKQTQLSNLVPLKTGLTQRIPAKCSQNIQFVATNLETAVQAHDFKQKFEADVRLNELPICIDSIVWIDESDLVCELDNGRRECDLSELAEAQKAPHFTHLVFFLERGKAYVNKGVMYLDTADPYSVFIHELAHFVGFVDEYAVSSKLAAQYCYSAFPSAPNLLISNAEIDAIQNEEKYLYWLKTAQATIVEPIYEANSVSQEGENTTGALSISRTNTCSKLDIVAYRPSRKMTFMEFHDVQHIPKLYKLMWQQKLANYHQKIMVANSLYEHSKTDGAREFWETLL